MQFYGKAAFVFLTIALIYTGDIVDSRRRGGRKSVKIKAGLKTFETGELHVCKNNACKALCQSQLGNKVVDIIGHCEGPICKCEYKEPCDIRKCDDLCAKKAKEDNRVNAKGICQRTDCLCQYEDDCNERTCNDECKKKYKQQGAKAKGICVDGECTCRHNR